MDNPRENWRNEEALERGEMDTSGSRHTERLGYPTPPEGIEVKGGRAVRGGGLVKDDEGKLVVPLRDRR